MASRVNEISTNARSCFARNNWVHKSCLCGIDPPRPQLPIPSDCWNMYCYFCIPSVIEWAVLKFTKNNTFADNYVIDECIMDYARGQASVCRGATYLPSPIITCCCTCWMQKIRRWWGWIFSSIRGRPAGKHPGNIGWANECLKVAVYDEWNGKLCR